MNFAIQIMLGNTVNICLLFATPLSMPNVEPNQL